MFTLFLFVSYGWCSSFDFIYINSSVDMAAGGHTAVRFDETIYHFQYYSDGYFLLAKDRWADFRYDYNDLQNRTINIVSIPLNDEVFTKIKQQFNRRYILQEKRIRSLEQLYREKRYFTNILNQEANFIVPGLGFFSTELTGAPFAGDLHKIIVDRLGSQHLKKLQNDLHYDLQNVPHRKSTAAPGKKHLDLYRASPPSANAFLDYSDTRAMQEALAVLIEERPVLSEALFTSPGHLSPLTPAEINKLAEYRARTVESIVTLLQPETGFDAQILLVQMARYQALSHAIKQKIPVTLDPFTRESDYISVDYLQTTKVATQLSSLPNKPVVPRSYFEELQYQRIRDAHIARKTFFEGDKDPDIAYSMMEKAFGELWELFHIEENQEYIRVEAGNRLPDRALFLIDNPGFDTSELKNRLAEIEQDIAHLTTLLLNTYTYNLVTKNCVTELFETLYSTFTAEDEAKKELNGYLVPGEYFSFVPFLSYHLVQDLFSGTSVESIPSYRIRKASLLYQQEGIWSVITESNTLTSTLYYPWEHDSTFLFFTDDVFLLRPLYGIGNLAYAALASLGGVVKAPFDNSTLLKRSLKGMLFSLPEIGFVNIRKGTFPAIDRSHEEYFSR